MSSFHSYLRPERQSGGQGALQRLSPPLSCNPLQGTNFYSTAGHKLILYCKAQAFSPLEGTNFYSTARHSVVLHCKAQLVIYDKAQTCTLLQGNELYSTARHKAVLHCKPLSCTPSIVNFSPLCCISLQCMHVTEWECTRLLCRF